MDFRFTEAQRRFRQEVRDFLDAELPKTAGEVGMGAGWSPDFSKALARRGWIALPWPKEYGGLARDHVDQAIFNEEMAYHRARSGRTAGASSTPPRSS